FLVLSSVRTADFQTPQTASGGIATFPVHSCGTDPSAGNICQSQVMALGSLVTSVRNSAGHTGRPDGSVPAVSPLRLLKPTAGLATHAGGAGESCTVAVLVAVLLAVFTLTLRTP